LRFDGNKLCAQCHLPEQYDTPEHHFHEENTEASQCINCHMTGKYYMGNDFRRDHSFRIPRPDLSLKYGTPNACTGCHEDKDDKWAWSEFKKQYGEVDSIHFSEKLAPGITRQPNAHIGLIELINDKTQPEIARASAARALSNYNSQNFIDEYITMLNDDSPLVRGASVDVLSEINNTDYVSSFLPLLKDPKRSVRIKAFYGLGGLGESKIPEKYKDAYQKVKKEFFTYLKTNSDFVGGRIKRANYYLEKGQLQKAIQGYESALAIDNINNQVRLDLANLYYRSQDFGKAEEAFKMVIEQEPEYGHTYYSLALLYAELERTDEAVEQMKTALKYIPENTRIYYNLSLLYDKKQDNRMAEKTLIQGLKIEPKNESLLYALAHHYSIYDQKEKAKKILSKLIKLNPTKLQYSEYFNYLDSKS